MKNLTTNRFSIVMHDLLKMPFIGESISKAKVEFSFIDVTARHIIKLARSMQYLLFIMYTHHVQ